MMGCVLDVVRRIKRGDVEKRLRAFPDLSVVESCAISNLGSWFVSLVKIRVDAILGGKTLPPLLPLEIKKPNKNFVA